MNNTMDILDMLEEERGFVKLKLRSGKEELGRPIRIVFDEDDEGWETIKTIMFEPYSGRDAQFYTLEEVESYEPIDKKDLPPKQ